MIDFTNSSMYGYSIIVYSSVNRHGSIIEKLTWSGMTMDQLSKWRWYFEYRRALLRVKYPKNCIMDDSFKHEISEKGKAEMIERAIKQKRKKITEFQNKLTKAELTWTSIFPIYQDDLYIKAAGKIENLKLELVELENQLKSVTNE